MLQQPLEDLIEVLDKQIVGDYKTKVSVLLTGVSAYTPCPLNLYLRGTPGSGKSYNATRVLRIFPKEDVWKIGKLSPTALVHQRGELYSEDGCKLEMPKREEYGDLNEYRKARREYEEKARSGHYRVFMHGKILLFLDAPHPETFHMLYPILSHDEWEIDYRITEKTKWGGLQTKHVKIVGWPATVFIRGREETVPEEFRRRCLIVCPEEGKEKVEKVNALTHKLNAYPWTKREIELDYDRARVWLSNLKANLLKLADICIPFEDIDKFYPAEVTADMTEFSFLENFIKTIAALNYYQRPRLKTDMGEILLASESDVKDGWAIFLNLFETSRTGLSQHLLDFYYKCLVPLGSFHTSEAVEKYNETFKPRRSKRTIENYLKILEETSYLTSDEDPNDKRKLIYRAIQTQKFAQNHANSDFARILTSDLQENFEKWRKNLRNNFPINIINKEDGTEKPVTVDQLHTYIIYNKTCLRKFYSVFYSPILEKKPEIHAKIDFAQIYANLKRLDRVDRKILPTEKCCLCGKHPVDYQVTWLDGSWDLLCEECGRQLEKIHQEGKLNGETEN